MSGSGTHQTRVRVCVCVYVRAEQSADRQSDNTHAHIHKIAHQPKYIYTVTLAHTHAHAHTFARNHHNHWRRCSSCVLNAFFRVSHVCECVASHMDRARLASERSIGCVSVQATQGFGAQRLMRWKRFDDTDWVLVLLAPMLRWFAWWRSCRVDDDDEAAAAAASLCCIWHIGESVMSTPAHSDALADSNACYCFSGCACAI